MFYHRQWNEVQEHSSHTTCFRSWGQERVQYNTIHFVSNDYHWIPGSRFYLHRLTYTNRLLLFQNHFLSMHILFLSWSGKQQLTFCPFLLVIPLSFFPNALLHLL